RHLGFEQLRAARPLHVHDNLRIGDVRDRVERRDADGVQAERDGRGHEHPDHGAPSDDGADQSNDHFFSFCSASMKKLPNVTTCSPAFTPPVTSVYSSPCRPISISFGEYCPDWSWT